MQIVERTVGGLGFPDGATLSQLFEAAAEHGLRPCPPATGPHLRLSTLGQEAAPDSIMSNGRAPSGSVTIASTPLRDDDEYPKGFYLRVVDGVPWLRGYAGTRVRGYRTAHLVCAGPTGLSVVGAGPSLSLEPPRPRATASLVKALIRPALTCTFMHSQ